MFNFLALLPGHGESKLRLQPHGSKKKILLGTAPGVGNVKDVTSAVETVGRAEITSRIKGAVVVVEGTKANFIAEESKTATAAEVAVAVKTALTEQS